MGCCNDTYQFGYFYYYDKNEEGRDWVGGAVYQESLRNRQRRAPPTMGRQQASRWVDGFSFVFKLRSLFFFSSYFSFFFYLSILGMYSCHTVFHRTGGRAKAVGGDKDRPIPFQECVCVCVCGSLYLLNFQVPKSGASHGLPSGEPQDSQFQGLPGRALVSFQWPMQATGVPILLLGH